MKFRFLPLLALVVSGFLLATAGLGTSQAQTRQMSEDGDGLGRACATPEPDAAEAAALSAAVGSWLKQNHTFAGGQIKVAFHVISSSTGEGNIPDSQIAAQIQTLNTEYSSMGFSFVLASTSRDVNNKWFGMTPGSRNEKTAKATLAVDPTHRLNVYTCKPGQSLLGWAYFPNSYPENNTLHGVVFHYGSVPGGYLSAYNEGETLTHEVGHYLGLYHTFQGGCTAPGDYVDDTPYEASAYTGGTCSLQRDTCPAAGLDPISNYMDYSYDACLTNFTTGQKTRMQAITAQYRPSILNAAARALDLASVSPAVTEAVGAVSFAGAMPNPSHGGTTLQYALPRAAQVSLRLYSVSGRMVTTIDQGAKDAGPHSVSFAGRNLSVGTYFAVLMVDGQKFTRTVILQ